MKIALIQCPSWSEIAPPYSPALLFACLRQGGHDVYCFDFNVKLYNYLSLPEREEAWGTGGGSNSWFNKSYVISLMEKHKVYVDYLVSQILNTNARIIGFTVYDTSRIFSEEIARRIKERDKDKIIIFGGPSCFRNSLYYTDFLKMYYVDAVCLQEGESALSDLVGKIEEEGKIVFCSGFAYKDDNGRIINCGEKGLLNNLDALPFADFSGFDLREYQRKTLPLSTSRGCICRCDFCNEAPVWGRYRNRSAQNIYKEIIFQLERHPGIENFFFNDSLINGNINMLNELADLIIKNRLRVRWGGQGRIRKEMTPEFLKRLRQAGLSHVSYGLESGSQNILSQMQKNLSLEIAEEVIRNTYKLDIYTTVNIIVGYPTETEKDVLETSDFLRRNAAFMNDIYFHPLVLMPDSPLYYHKDKFGIELRDANEINLWYTRDGKNNYQTRLERIEFYKSILNDKYASNISMFDYYLTIGEQFYKREEFESALKFYLKAKNESRDIHKINLIDNKISFIRKKLAIVSNL